MLLCCSGCAFPSSSGADEPFPAEIRTLQIDPNPALAGDTIKLNLDLTLFDTTLQIIEYAWYIGDAARIDTSTSIPEFSWVADVPAGEYRGQVSVSSPMALNGLSKSFTITIEE